MLDYADSPPSLRHSPTPSDHSQGRSRDSTPITPVSSTVSFRKDASLPWFSRPLVSGRRKTHIPVEPSVLQPDFDDNSFPSFGASPPSTSMASAAAPVNINIRPTSTSPRGNQQSTLTSALKRGNSGDANNIDGMSTDHLRPTPHFQPEQMMDGHRSETGARPISVKGRQNDRMRRESLAQSLGTGMSWGGVSVNSWIRDEYVNTTLSILTGC